MKRLGFILAVALAAGACSRGDAFEIPAGSDVTLQKKDGIRVEGRLVEVQPNQVIVEDRAGVKTTVPRAQIAEMRTTVTPPVKTDAAPAKPDAANDAVRKGPVAATAEEPPALPVETDRPATSSRSSEADSTPAFREITLPAGTELPLTLRTSVGSETSNIEDPVRATLRTAVTARGAEALPAGTSVLGHVTEAQRSARVKGRAAVAFRFTRVDLPGEGGVTNIRTATVSRTAAGTKKQDAAKIGGGAIGGAIIGGIIGGGDGAAKGAAIGGAGGTGVVLATRGKEVVLAAGSPITVKLTQPLTLRVRVR
jgi:hypothetical protein